MAQESNSQDPLEFVKGMWNNLGFSLPGMITPTLDPDELERRIKDMRAVEGWLKMNLNMLQMSIQGLEMQRAALTAVRAISEQGRSQKEEESKADDTPNAADANPFATAMWPWNMLAQQQASVAAPSEPQPATKTGRSRGTTAKKD